MTTTVKKAALQLLIGGSLNILDLEDLKLLSASAIQKKLLQNLDVNPDYDTTADESSYVDVGCQASSLDQYSSTFCCNETLPLSSKFDGPPLIDGKEKPMFEFDPASIAKHSTSDAMDYCSVVRRRNPDHGNMRVNSSAAVDGALHFLKMVLETKSAGAQYNKLLSYSAEPLRTLTNVFDVARGIEEMLREVVVLKRAKDTHNGDYHNNIVGLLSTVCAENTQIRNCVIEKLEKLLTSASSDEEDVWCVGLLIEDVSVNDSATCFLMMRMLCHLFWFSIENSVRQNEYSQAQSFFSFCLLETTSNILRFAKQLLEKSIDEKSIHLTIELLMNFKMFLVKILNEIRTNHNLLLVSNKFQKIIDNTEDCINYAQDKSINIICN